MEQYTDEDFETDVEWLQSYNINDEEARDFIFNLLKMGSKLTEKELNDIGKKNE